MNHHLSDFSSCYAAASGGWWHTRTQCLSTSAIILWAIWVRQPQPWPGQDSQRRKKTSNGQKNTCVHQMCVFPFTSLKRLTTLLFILCPAGIWLYPNRSILSSRGLWWRWWRHGICPCPASCTPVSYFTNCFCFMAAAVSCLLLSLRIKAHFIRYLPLSKLMLSSHRCF